MTHNTDGIAMSRPVIFTIGHSTHPYEHFLRLVRDAGVTAIADVRSAPFSRRFPQFNGNALENALRRDGVAYLFLGKELGGRPAGRAYYCDGGVDYERVARAPMFRDGIARIMESAGQQRIALMCAEHDPLSCHRCLLVGRVLAAKGAAVRHILADGAITDQREIEERLLQAAGGADGDLFLSEQDLLAHAYRKWVRKRAPAGPSANKEC